MDLHVLALAFALVLILEGVGPLLFPQRWQQYLREVANQPAAVLQRLGAGLMITGAILLYFLL